MEGHVASSLGWLEGRPYWFEVCVHPLRRRLDLTVRELMSDYSRDQERFRRLLEVRVGETCLEDYWTVYEGGFAKAIPDWCHRLQARVRAFLEIDPDSAGDGIW